MNGLTASLRNFTPLCEQEKKDKEIMLRFAKEQPDCLLRSNKIAHFTASAWIVNKEHTKVLFIFHKIYDSWSWVGGHADGESDLRSVALKEAREETGISPDSVVSEDILSIETLPVDAHFRRGEYIAPHLHFNLTYLIEADENEPLRLNEDETKGVQWFTFEEAFKASTEKKMIERVYKKLSARS